MAPLHVELSESLKEFVDVQVREQRATSAEEFVRVLIEREQRRWADEKLEEMLLEGINSGPGEEVTPEFWRKLREELHLRREEAAG